MSDIFGKIAEDRIREAFEKGEFDHLEGFGKPVDNEDYFSVPEEERMAFHILKNSGVVPPEVELRRELYNVSRLIRMATSQDEKEGWIKKQSLLASKISMLVENRKLKR